MRLGYAACALMLISMAACSSPSPAPEPAATTTAADDLQWKSAPDSSFVSHREIENAPFGHTVRCWSRAGKFDCLRVNLSGAVGYVVERRILPALPKTWPQTTGGYSCTFGGQYRVVVEEIAGPRGRITSNSGLGTLEKPWSKAKADQLMKDNGIAGVYLNCPRLASVIGAKGSLATVASTALTYGDLG